MACREADGSSESTVENELQEMKLSTEGSDDVIKISYDDALAKYGSGRYQIVVLLFMSVITFSTVFNNSGYIFIGAKQTVTCRTPENAYNYGENGNSSATITYELGECMYDTIAQYDDNTSQVLEKDVKCNSWDYDQSEFVVTMISEWDLNLCNGSWYTAVANSLYMVGFLIGCVVLADMADRYGRNLILVISNVAMVILGITAAFSVNFYMLIIARFLLGIFTAGARNAAFVYVCEMVTYREAAGMIIGVVYCIGGVVVTVMAYALSSNWRYFQLACALSYCIFIPYFWIFPESARWVLSKGQKQKAVDFFRMSARINKVAIPERFEVYIEHKPERGGNLLSLFKTPNVRKKTIVVCIQWFGVSIVYFGMHFNVGNLTGNIFANNIFLQAVGIIQFFGIWYLKLGRRVAISSAFLITSIGSFVLPIFAAYEIKAAVIAMSMLGACLTITNFCMIYIITAEVYPTQERVTALGLGSSLARVGGALSPYVVLTHDLWPNLPYIMFGGIALIAGLIGVTLPETKDKPLPDSLHQVETENPLNSFICCTKKPENEKSGHLYNDEA